MEPKHDQNMFDQNITMELFFEKIVNSFFKLLTIFAKAKKAPSQMLDWVENILLTKGLKY